jgi:hypothetical protein
MGTMLMSKNLYRNKTDHLTDKPFVKSKCKKCNKYYLRMSIDKELKLCIHCSNGKEEYETHV